MSEPKKSRVQILQDVIEVARRIDHVRRRTCRFAAN